jgi:hypothetical protein
MDERRRIGKGRLGYRFQLGKCLSSSLLQPFLKTALQTERPDLVIDCSPDLPRHHGLAARLPQHRDVK